MKQYLIPAAPRKRSTLRHAAVPHYYRGKSFLGLLAGVVVGGLVAFATGGIGLLALTAFAVTAQAVNFFLGPKGGIQSPSVSSPQSLSRPTNATGREATAQQLNVASSSEAIAIPVPFGRVKLVGNFLRYDRSTFAAQPLTERVKIESPTVRQTVNVQQSTGKGFGGGGSTQSAPTSGSRSQDRREKYQDRVIGYNYRLSWEYGLCMGEIDEIHEVTSNPGNKPLLSTSVSSVQNSFLLTLSGQDQGGTVRLYKGANGFGTQFRVVGEPYFPIGTQTINNYRHVCFALFNNFLIGKSPSPPTYMFELTRLPKPLDDSDTLITTIHQRGGEQFTISSITSDGTTWTVTTSAANTFKAGDEIRIAAVTVAGHDGKHIVDSVTSTTVFEIANTANLSAASDGTVHHLSYEDANPAAILWEVLTNKVWGRGESVDKMNQASFETASNYFRDHNIGMSFHLETQDVVSDAIDSIRLHTGTVLVWDGLEIHCLNMEDKDTAYSPRHVLNQENLKDVSFSRDTWFSTTNELRCEFVNRENNYQSEIVMVQDIAARFTAGRVNSKKIALKAFSVRSVAEPQARRILHDMAYPRARLTCRMNDFERRLLPGDFVEIRWRETDSDLTHTYWRVMQIDDSGQHDQGFQLVLVEDQYAVSYAGVTDPTFTAPTPFTDFTAGIPTDRLYFGDDFTTQAAAGTLTPHRIDDLNIFATAGTDASAFGFNRSNRALGGVDLFWKLTTEGSGEYKKLGFFSPWIVGGDLKDAIPLTASSLDRSLEFNFVIDDELHEADMLASANKVDVDADDMETLTTANSDMLRINGEIFLVGKIETNGFVGIQTRYRARNVIRAQFGTVQETHAVDDRVAYVENYSPARYEVPRGTIPVDTTVDFKAQPIGALQPYPDSDAYEFTGQMGDSGSQGFPPSLFSVSTVVTTSIAWTLKLRPRWHLVGAGIFSSLQDNLNERVTAIEPGYGWYVEEFKATVSQGDAVFASAMTFVADDGFLPTTGLLELDFTSSDPLVDELRFYTSINGIVSTDYLSVSINDGPST